jgi:hypothetical protein
MAKKAFGGKKAAPFRKGGKPRKSGTVRRKPRRK